jgi:hypothetical protein
MQYQDKRTGEKVEIEKVSGFHNGITIPDIHPYFVKHPNGDNYYISEDRLTAQFQPIKVAKEEPKE